MEAFGIERPTVEHLFGDALHNLETMLKMTVSRLTGFEPHWQFRIKHPVWVQCCTHGVIGQVTGQPFFEADLSKLGYKPSHTLKTEEEKLERRVWAGQWGYGIPPEFEKDAYGLFWKVPTWREFLEKFWNAQAKGIPAS